MSAYIVLDDGRVLWRSNLAMDGLLHLIAQQLPEEHRNLKTWLADKGSRPAPFIDFDLRGLSPVHRSAFYAAARRAMDELLRKDAHAVEQGYSAEAIDRLLRMKESMDRGEPPLNLSDDKIRPFDGQQIDLSEIWGLEAASGRTGPDSSNRESARPAHSVAARIGLLLILGAGTAAGVSAGWYFGSADASLLELSGFIALALVLTWSVTAWLLFVRGRA